MSAASPLQENRAAVWTVVLLSAFHNILVLSGSLYMMLIYDMVIPSRNPVSLVGLLIILLVAYAFQSGFDLLRSNILRRAAGDLYDKYSRRAFLAVQEGQSRDEPVNDLEKVRAYLSGPGPGALIDLPWMLLYLGILFLLHFWLGITGLVGIIVLSALAWLNNHSMKQPTKDATEVAGDRQRFLQETRMQSEPLLSLGMRERAADLWHARTERHLTIQQRLAAVGGNLAGLSKTFRMLLQSLILTVGALLVIDDKATGGIIIASSIIGSRALAPIEAAISTWKPMLAARDAWKRIKEMPAPSEAKMTLPAPSGTLEIEDLTLTVPNRKLPVLSKVSLKAEAGQVIAIVGPSAAGKTTLLRAIAGQIPEAWKSIRLDGASYEQWDINDLGQHLGYLSQEPLFLSGTVAQNISRFEQDIEADHVTAAATAAGAHEMILRMDDGYNAAMMPRGPGQSGGQRQRIGLARALYGDPFLVLLDEPNSNLDGEGEAALTKAIEGLRSRGALVLVASHRPSVLQAATDILVLREGMMQAYGKREEILPKLLGRQAA